MTASASSRGATAGAATKPRRRLASVLVVALCQLGLVAVAPMASAAPVGVAVTPASGGVIAWGRDDEGQSTVPTSAQSGVTAIAASFYRHNLALKADGSVVAWGGNDFGQATVPTAAASGITAVAAGYLHSLVLKADGSVVAWGGNDYGQAIVPTSARSGVTAIAAQGFHSLALKADGSVVAWGYDQYGQSTVPTLARSGVTAIAAGYEHSLALKADGSVIAWGNNSSGQVTVPTSAQSGVTAIAAGNLHSLALKADGSVVAWGNNGFGQVTVPTSAQSEISAIAAGALHSMALRADGSVVAWGWNEYGQATVPVAARSDANAIAAGSEHSLALVVTVPGPPLEVTAVPGDRSATITWLKPSSDGGSPITGYLVTASPGGLSCSTNSADVLSCTITGLSNGLNYTFTVRAISAAGTSDPGTGPAAPGAGAGAGAGGVVVGNPPPPVTVNPPVLDPADGTKVTLSWLAAAADPETPVIGYTATATPGDRSCSTTGALSCTITGLTVGQNYVFKVVAINGVGSGPSSPAPAISLDVTPSDPTLTAGATQQLAATGTYFGGATKDLTADVTWSTSDSSVATVSTGGLVSAVAPGSATITAADGTLRGSVTITVTSSTPGITWATPSDITYGQALSVTELNASSSVPGTFTYSPPAGTVLNAGKHTLTATFTPTDSVRYRTATTTTEIQVDRATLAVAAEAKTKVYGQANPALTYRLVGLLNGDTAADVTGTPVLSTTATSASGVGSYPVSVDTSGLSSSNYSVIGQSSTLAVTPATLTVAAAAKTKVYGQANPALTFTLTGLVNGDTASVVTGVPVLSTTATVGSGVGSYPIRVVTSGLSASDYVFAGADATLSVTPATLTVAADPKTKVYGQANPALTYDLTGFVNGDTASVVTGVPVLSTTATVGSGVGSYPIRVVTSGLSASDYVFAGADATLSVTPATLTVAADPKTKVYGQANPALTYDLTGFVNGDTASVVTGVPVLSTTATVGSGVGSYPIRVVTSGLSASDYVFAGADATLSVTPATLTVAADPKTKVYGQANPALTYAVTGLVAGDTANVLTGSPTLDTVATTSSGTGSYPITVDVSDVTAVNYVITAQDSALSVGSATLTVVATAKTKVYGQANPELTYSIVGFANGDTASVVTGTPTLSTTATTASDTGSYPVSVDTSDVSSANYTIVGQGATMAVTPATLTVEADVKTKIYGQANPELTYSIVGFANGDTASVVTGTPTLSTTATRASDIGSYAVSVSTSGMAAENYTVGGQGATLAVTPATLTVEAVAKTKVYGQANPALTYEITGLVNSDTASVVTGTPTLSTTATTGSSTGAYPIAVVTAGMSARNYGIVGQAATLTVTPATLTLAAAPKTTVYGSAIPVLTYTVTGLVNGDTSSVVTGTPNLSTTAMATTSNLSNVGAYPITITVGSAKAANYALATSNSTLTITPAPTTLTGLTIFTGSNSLFTLAATLTYVRLGASTPVPSQTLTFSTLSGNNLCTGNTASTGRATCTPPGLLNGLFGNIFGAFRVSYAGATNFQASKTVN